jgi:hypothetical protein
MAATSSLAHRWNIDRKLAIELVYLYVTKEMKKKGGVVK